MPPTQVVILDLPVLLRDLLMAVLAGHPEVRVRVLESTTDTPWPDFDLAFVDLPDGELGPSGVDLLDRVSRPKLLGLYDDGRTGFLYELRPHRTPLGELSGPLLDRVLASMGGGRP